MYQIKIHYKTGNSFGSNDCKDLLELTWNDLNIAKENLKAIKEHYSMYQALNGYSRNTESKEQILTKYQDAEWYCNKYPEFSLKLKTDKGNIMQIHPFWTGYFEQLYSAKIVSSKDDDMSFTV